ncbi:MAG: pyridoxal phosphate-dependent aminotransferase [Candidatus Kerfeldbacteria bacterium]|nr:pyridoxal phosphate-dependent aminotransferase [Candidatus Kerfeldbacteria bacterium]
MMTERSRPPVDTSRPHLYDPDDLMVVHDIAQSHWRKASIPPVNRWAEYLDAEASSRDDIYRRLGLVKVHMGVGDANVGILHDELISGIDLLVSETRRHTGTTFGLTMADAEELFQYINNFPGKLVDQALAWMTSTHEQLKGANIEVETIAGLHSSFPERSLETVQEWMRQRPQRILDALINMTPDVGFPYGKMTGWGPALAAHKTFFQHHCGVEARDHFCMHAGDRNAVFHATHSVREYMEASKRPKFGLITPSWGTYEVIITGYYGPDALVTLECPNGIPDSEKVDKFLTENPDVGCLIMCNPNNPSGDVFGSSRLVNLLQVLYKHQVPAISDELYMLFVYDREHRSLARAAAELWKSDRHHDVGKWAANNIMVLGVGVQKVVGSGKRCSAAWIPNTYWRSRFVSSQGASAGQPAILSQAISTSVINSRGYVRGYTEMKLRRDAMLEMLANLKTELAETPFTVEHSSGQGAFYLAVYFNGLSGMQYTPNLNGEGKVTITSSEDVAMWLVDQAAVIGSPASTALITDPRFIRLSYGNLQRDQIPVAGRQIGAALKALAQMNGY